MWCRKERKLKLKPPPQLLCIQSSLPPSFSDTLQYFTEPWHPNKQVTHIQDLISGLHSTSHEALHEDQVGINKHEEEISQVGTKLVFTVASAEVGQDTT